MPQIARVDVLLLLVVDVCLQNLAQFAGLLGEFVDLVLKAGFFAFPGPQGFRRQFNQELAVLEMFSGAVGCVVAWHILVHLVHKLPSYAVSGGILLGETLVAHTLIQFGQCAAMRRGNKLTAGRRALLSMEAEGAIETPVQFRRGQTPQCRQ